MGQYNEAKITFIKHSSFLVELENCSLLFDYFEGDLPLIPENKPLFVFASHKHSDHYSRKIFTLNHSSSTITYLLSKDIKMNEKYMERIGIPEEVRAHIHFLGSRKKYIIADGMVEEQKETDKMVYSGVLTVETLHSTDAGLAFIITCGNFVIYHAGDLNWWTWEGETDAEYKEMTKNFKGELKVLEGRHITIAFLPLDKRQEDRYALGFDYFMKHISAEYAFPMHCWGDFSVIKMLRESCCSDGYREQVMDIIKEGQKFYLTAD